MSASRSHTGSLITFEHPVNEQVRLYLRLEHLFQEFHTRLPIQNHNQGKTALFSLLKMVNVVDRPDLKSKLVQTLTAHAINLGNLKQSPEVDKTRLHTVLHQLEQHISHLHRHTGKFAEELRQNEFLNQIRMHLMNPAGACESMLPAFHLWLNRSPEECQYDLNLWYQSFVELERTITLLLSLIRQSTHAQKKIAPQGFYQQNADPNIPYELIQVTLSADLDLFPECSANKHRIIIRFLKPDIYQGGRPIQTALDIQFELACCKI